MLIGEYNHKSDNKNRISLPAKFRKDLTDTVVVTRGLEGSLSLYSHPEWRKLLEKIEKLPAANEGARKVQRFFLSGAMEIEIDSAGRILIPQHLRKFANINEEVTLVGLQNKVELWNTNDWKNYSKKMEGENDITKSLDDITSF